MATVKLTSKRQATFPASILKELGLKEGDEVELVSKKLKGEVVWLIKPIRRSTQWYGALSKYAKSTVPPPEAWRDIISPRIAGKER